MKIVDNLFYGVDRALGRQRRVPPGGEGPAEISVEHNTIVQTGNIITAYGGTREAPSAADRFVFKDNITLHNANGVIGQGLAVGNDTLSSTFPARRSIATSWRAYASRYPADNSFPPVDWLWEQFQNVAEHDYRLRPGARCASRERQPRRGA